MRAHRSIPVLAECLAIVLVAALPAGALTRGGGPTGTDCIAEFDVVPANYPPERPREIRCTDGDPACDRDETVGRCGFAIGVCLNVTDASLPDCVAKPIVSFEVRNFRPTNPKYVVEFQTVQDEVSALLPLAETEHDRCTTDGGHDPVIVIVPLKATSGGYKKASRTLRSHLDWENTPGHTKDDLDRIKMTCLPGTPLP
jgi:hypothetical protein